VKLNELTPSVPKKNRKRIGRGNSSGWGKTAGKGSNGQNSRAGGGVKPYFEGGQMPIYRRVPKRGFSNAIFKKEYTVISLSLLNDNFEDGEEVSLAIFEDVLRLLFEQDLVTRQEMNLLLAMATDRVLGDDANLIRANMLRQLLQEVDRKGK